MSGMRSQADLARLARERQQYKARLTTAFNDEDDPLAVYDEYVKWALHNYGDKNDSESGLRGILEEATRQFKDDQMYKKDLRYLKMWTLYAKQQNGEDKVVAIYKYLISAEIGAPFSLLYEEFAAILERNGRLADADAVYRKGIRKNVRPLERLKSRYEQFKTRTGFSPSSSSLPPPPPTTSSAVAAAIAGPSRTNDNVANSVFLSTPASRYAQMLAPPPPGKRPERMRFTLSLLFTDEGVEYSVQEARARSMGLLGKKWGPPPPSEMRTLRGGPSESQARPSKRLASRHDPDGTFAEDDRDNRSGNSSEVRAIVPLPKGGRRRSSFKLGVGTEPTMTINTKEALADVFGMYNSPEKTRSLRGVVGSKYAPLQKVHVEEDILREETADSQVGSSENRFGLRSENAHAKTPTASFRPFVDENSSRITPGPSKFIPFVDAPRTQQPAITPRPALAAKDSSSVFSSTPSLQLRPSAMADNSDITPRAVLRAKPSVFPSLEDEQPRQTPFSKVFTPANTGAPAKLAPFREVFTEDHGKPQPRPSPTHERAKSHNEIFQPSDRLQAQSQQDQQRQQQPLGESVRTPFNFRVFTRPPDNREAESAGLARLENAFTPKASLASSVVSRQAFTPFRDAPPTPAFVPFVDAPQLKVREKEVEFVENEEEDEDEHDGEREVIGGEEQRREVRGGGETEDSPVEPEDDEGFGQEEAEDDQEEEGEGEEEEENSVDPEGEDDGVYDQDFEAEDPKEGDAESDWYEVSPPPGERSEGSEGDGQYVGQEPYEEGGETYREVPLGGRFGQFNVMTPITERTFEFTSSRSVFSGTPSERFGRVEEEEEEEEVGDQHMLGIGGAVDRLADDLNKSKILDDGDQGLSKPPRGVRPPVSPFRLSVELAPALEEKRATGMLSLSDTLTLGSQFRPENPCNPFDPSILSALLMRIPSDSMFHDMRDQESDKLDLLQKFAKKGRKTSTSGRSSGDGSLTLDLVLGGQKFKVTEKLGEGGFGAVFKALDCGSASSSSTKGDSDSDSDLYEDEDEDDLSYVAIKVVKPRNLWEYHVLRRLHTALPSSLLHSIVTPHALYAFRDESFLILDLCPHGTLLHIVNSSSSAGVSQPGACLDELLVFFFTIELLKLIESMHRIGFIHGDFKIDNCLLRLEDVPGGPSAWSSTYSPSGDGGWSSKGLKVIDFGRTVDTRLFPPSQTYIAEWETDEKDCFEIREGRAWTYQTDYFGLAGIVYCMLFGKYMQSGVVVQVDDDGDDDEATVRRYKIGTPFKRYWQGDLWNRLFDLLLNPCLARPKGDLPLCNELAALRKEMETWLQANCNRTSGTLKGMLKKVEVACLIG